MKKINCRAHGGKFSIEARRGRPPVRCNDENPCSAVATQPNAKPLRQIASELAQPMRKPTKKELAAKRAELAESDAKARSAGKAAPSPTSPVGIRQAALETAKKAKAQLVEQGWDVRGEAKGDSVIVSGHRGEELICLTWRATINGTTFSQDYSLWSVDKASRNGFIPAHSLPFDPEWVTDKELSAHLVGNKITWWNRISGKEEKGVCGKDTISIEHRFDGAGHEIPSERLIKFIDDGGPMRLIQLGQLLKVGK